MRWWRASKALRGRGRQLSSTDFAPWKDVYNDRALKRALWRSQSHKCCYCEMEYQATNSDVEHFRPKTAADRMNGTVDEGYWWLAFEFRNLFFSCPNCNRLSSTKNDKFPLHDPVGRLRPQELPWCRAEGALVINPDGTEQAGGAEAHLTFVQDGTGCWRIAPRRRSPFGRKTIEVCGLDRDELDELRDKHVVSHLQPALDAYRCARTRGQRDAALRAARRLCEPGEPFSLLAREFFLQQGMDMAQRARP
ncbi:MAG: hypothetical protein HY904_19980 [Deltaproteobacteria bacterium]|nr:hypothetical protein [Deltaproteobacteria bacterium]